MTPVVLLTDGYLANGSEPWKIPNVESLDPIDIEFVEGVKDGEEFFPYKRDEKDLNFQQLKLRSKQFLLKTEFFDELQ